MELRHDNALCAIDHESALLGHVRYSAEIDILNRGVEVLMIRVSAIEFQLRL